ncbi:MAG: hypothetical protein AAFV95_27395 [Bacteroidota bacterium]
MKNQDPNHRESPKSSRLTIENFSSVFCPFLHERFFNVVNHFLELEGKFTLIVNMLDRSDQDSIEQEMMIYAGLDKQRKLLEQTFGKKTSPKGLEAFKKLSKYVFQAGAGVATGELYQEFKEGKLGMEDIKEGYLSTYFGQYLHNGRFENDGQELEHPILDHFFDISKDKYMSIPLIQFGKFDGVVHIVYEEGLSHKIKATDKQKQLIRLLVFEYEAILLDYDSFGENIYKSSMLKQGIDRLASEEYYQKDNPNKILQELNLQEYYRANKAYFAERMRQNDAIPTELLKQHHKNAIMSIIIDSYAHNMSAHSLTALEWWFRLRAQRFEEEEEDANEMLLLENYPSIPVVISSKRFAGEIHPLLRFLLDKGAFWTGLTRKGSFGGKISSLYSVLWHNFIQNPLYLGTIAFSEGILKLNINVTIYESRTTSENGIHRRKQIKKTTNREYLNGHFVKIDLEEFYDPNKSQKHKHTKFVTPGRLFDDFKEELKQTRVYFPGGVVGRHAFFTILENEIRNVKHFKPAQIEHMKTHGLTLNISVEPTTFEEVRDIPMGKECELFVIGVWLKHPVKIDYDLLTEKLKRLEGDIVDKNYIPKLGGSYQDKVCAAMLMNNEFISVQNQESRRDKKFYPWMKTGTSQFDRPQADEKVGVVEDMEISLRRLKPERYKLLHGGSEQYSEAKYQEFVSAADDLKNNYQSRKGYLKKFFHLWRGENIYHYNKEKSIHLEWENLARFRFMSLSKEARADHEVRKSGVIRLIEQAADSIEEAYCLWLRQWLNCQSGYQVTIKVANQTAARLVFDNDRVTYYNYEKYLELSKSERQDFQKFDGQQTINMVHSEREITTASENICRYRSHGIFIKQICEGNSPSEAVITEKDGKAAELLETVATRVGIFDNRIANRIKRTNATTLSESLRCCIYEEQTPLWEEEKKAGFDKFHFLVVHLSFIEAFRDEKGYKKYSEKDMAKFIDNEILQGRKEMPKNFRLVITTGRGRTHWWSKLEELDQTTDSSYTRFTTFRPVESLIASIEDSISKKDDIELKYRLVKVLFGS